MRGRRPLSRSLLRMSVGARLVVSLTVSAALWLAILWALA
jgi:hypothetical protein